MHTKKCHYNIQVISHSWGKRYIVNLAWFSKVRMQTVCNIGRHCETTMSNNREISSEQDSDFSPKPAKQTVRHWSKLRNSSSFDYPRSWTSRTVRRGVITIEYMNSKYARVGAQVMSHTNCYFNQIRINNTDWGPTLIAEVLLRPIRRMH